MDMPAADDCGSPLNTEDGDGGHMHFVIGGIGNSHTYLLGYLAADDQEHPANGNWVHNVIGFSCRMINKTSKDTKKITLSPPILRYYNHRTKDTWNITMSSWVGTMEYLYWGRGEGWPGDESGDSIDVCGYIEADRTYERGLIGDPDTHFVGFILPGSNGGAGAGTSGFNIEMFRWRPIVATDERTDPPRGDLNGTTKPWLVVPINQVGNEDKIASIVANKQLTGKNLFRSLAPITVADEPSLGVVDSPEAITMDLEEDSE